MQNTSTRADDGLSGGPFSGISVITLFTEDVTKSKEFHRTVFGAVVVFEDATSAVIRMGRSLINLLHTDSAVELMSPGRVGGAKSGTRAMFTIEVDDVDTLSAQFSSRGAQLLNGPMDRPWGVRTASFVDPSGHVWEIAQPLDGMDT